MCIEYARPPARPLARAPVRQRARLPILLQPVGTIMHAFLQQLFCDSSPSMVEIVRHNRAAGSRVC